MSEESNSDTDPQSRVVAAVARANDGRSAALAEAKRRESASVEREERADDGLSAALAVAVAERRESASLEQEGDEISPEDRLHRKLMAPVGWVHVARLLHDEVRLTQEEIARGAHVQPVTVARWLQRPDDAYIRATDGLDRLRALVMAMLVRPGMSIKLLRFWLGAIDAELGTDPLTALSERRFEQVVDSGVAVSDVRRLRLVAE